MYAKSSFPLLTRKAHSLHLKKLQVFCFLGGILGGILGEMIADKVTGTVYNTKASSRWQNKQTFLHFYRALFSRIFPIEAFFHRDPVLSKKGKDFHKSRTFVLFGLATGLLQFLIYLYSR